MDREILAVKTRKDLYDFVRKNPGFHLRELSRALNLSITLADYHLRFLEKHELITSAMDGEYKRFFPRSTPGQAEARSALTETEKQILAFLRQPVPLKVIDFLMEREAATHKEILEQVPVSPSTLSHHLKKMQAAGIIAHAEPTERGYRVVDPRSVARLMPTYELATPDQVDTFIRVWGEFRLCPESEDPHEFRRDPFEEVFVRRRERVCLIRIDVDLCNRRAVAQDRDDDFRTRIDETLQVPRVVVHVGDDDRRLFRHRGSANPLAYRNPRMQGRGGPRPRGEDEFRSVDRIDSDPREVGDFPELPTHEVGDRLSLAARVDDFLQAGGDLVVADLPLFAGPPLAELSHALPPCMPRFEQSPPPLD